MLFKLELADKILKGQKTQTRRMVKPNDVPLFFTAITKQFYPEQHSGYAGVQKRWSVGKDYAICPGRGKFQVGRMRITALRQECVQDITDADAVREGFANRQEFLDVFKKINPKSKLTDAVWVIDFEVVSDG